MNKQLPIKNLRIIIIYKDSFEVKTITRFINNLCI